MLQAALRPFGPAQDSSAFACGVAALDAYLRTQANQDMRRRASACYVALDKLARATPDNPQVAAYYTLAAAGVALTDLPATLAQRLPRYPSVPVARVGRTLLCAPWVRALWRGAKTIDPAFGSPQGDWLKSNRAAQVAQGAMTLPSRCPGQG